ncbi:alpha/beta hydrolase family protein [Chitinophaga varians]|uniref:alpha/beta hydrolase family protein n=1 Tax=Chitinophaga varians TaxID=2202339 RepID=UPI00165F6298|nr:prolyl oligopeptidase family serine peptidase [Chitinophaga varians]MBC9915097.1 S9 family peptidase [Chitinophaga varians]
MKRHSLLFLITLVFKLTVAQKPSLDFNSADNWPSVTNGKISDDGNYVCYQVTNDPVGKKTTVILSTDQTRHWKYIDLNSTSFTTNSRFAMGKILDTLLILDLYENKERKIPNVGQYEIINTSESPVVMYIETKKKSLFIESIKGSVYLQYDSIESFHTSPDKKSFITVAREKKTSLEILSWVTIGTYKIKNIYKGPTTSQLIFDKESKQLSFFSRKKDSIAIWYYKTEDQSAKELLNSYSPTIDTNLVIEAGMNWRFSPNGELLIFDLAEKKRKKTIASNPEIWNYKDIYLLSRFKGGMMGPNFKPRFYLTSINVHSSQITRLLSMEEAIEPYSFQTPNSRYCVYISNRKYDPRGANDNSFTFTYGICDIQTGKKTIISEKCIDMLQKFTFSPDNKFLVYYKTETGKFYSYNIASAKEICLSNTDSSAMFSSLFKDYPAPRRVPGEIVGWLNDKPKVLISDVNDIWSFDLAQSNQAICLTNGLGKKEKMIFNPIENPENGFTSKTRSYNSKDLLILKAFDLKTKNRGYYTLSLKNPISLNPLSMNQDATGRFFYEYESLPSTDFCRAKSGNGYLVKKEKFNDAPNYFYSKDLKTFQRISNIQPQKNYNWLTAELHTYSDSVGREYQGILYKPENFDSTRSYPIIFYYYDQITNEINTFPNADLTPGTLNIPYYTSHGYLVFRPDMNTTPYKTGEGILSTINTSMDYLSNFSWVNLKKIAMTGWSLGGWETDYIITHIQRPITAAVSGAGASDLTSVSLMLGSFGQTKIDYVQYGQMKIGYSPEENPQIYIDHSPLFFAKNVKTPLLLLHNPEDRNVEDYQSRAFFILLRKLGKPAWLISYKGEAHAINKKENQLDFAKRLSEYLDHFLKDAPEPAWMNQSINTED